MEQFEDLFYFTPSLLRKSIHERCKMSQSSLQRLRIKGTKGILKSSEQLMNVEVAR